jgi:hemerythrin superfamily protein
MADVVDLILADHREMERLFDVLQKEPERRRLELPVLSTLLVAHSRAEEAAVYPAARNEAGETGEVAHSQEEHAEAEQLLERLRECDPSSSAFDAALRKLVDAVSHHIEEEESNVLPGLRDKLDRTRRDQLAEAFAASREEHLGERPGEPTREELLVQARNAGVDGASSMSKDELARALEP